MIPDPPRGVETPLVAGGKGGPARDDDEHHGPSRAGLCWLCGYAIIDPPEVIGHYRASRARLAHRYCLRVLGELDLDLPPAS